MVLKKFKYTVSYLVPSIHILISLKFTFGILWFISKATALVYCFFIAELLKSFWRKWIKIPLPEPRPLKTWASLPYLNKVITFGMSYHNLDCNYNASTEHNFSHLAVALLFSQRGNHDTLSLSTKTPRKYYYNSDPVSFCSGIMKL